MKYFSKERKASVALFMSLFFTFFTVLTAAPAARGEEVRRISLFVVPATTAEKDAANLIGQTMRAYGEQLTEVEMVTPAPIPKKSSIPEISEQIEHAYKLLNNKQLQQAVAFLVGNQQTINQIMPGLSRRTLAIYFKAMGVSQALQKNIAGAKQALELSLMLWPEQSPLEYAYSVEVLTMFSSLQSEIQARPVVELYVTTNPPEAMVTLDQNEILESPASFKAVTAGKHLIKVTVDGYEQWAGYVDVKPAGRTTHEVTLKEIQDKRTFDKRFAAVVAALPKGEDEAQAALQDFKDFLAVNDLLVISTRVIGRTYELNGYLFMDDGSLVPVKKTIEKDEEFIAGIKEMLSSTFDAYFGIAAKAEGMGGPPIDPALLQKAGISTENNANLFDPDNPVFPEVKRKQQQKTTFTDKWWFWTGVGVLVAGAMVGGGYLIFTGDDGGGPRGVIDVKINNY